MALNLVRTGFQPLVDVAGTPICFIRRKVASNNGTAIFLGDCLVYTAAGVVGLATAGAGVIGVSGGAEYWDATKAGRISNPYLPASTTYTGTGFDMWGDTDESFVFVSDSPVTDRFVSSYSTGLPALTDITKNANFTAGTAGTTYNGLSGHVLDQTTIAANASRDFRIIDVLKNVLSDPTQGVSTSGVQPGVVCQINLAATQGVPDVVGNAGV